MALPFCKRIARSRGIRRRAQNPVLSFYLHPFDAPLRRSAVSCKNNVFASLIRVFASFAFVNLFMPVYLWLEFLYRQPILTLL
jgi:hypothetical protein